MSAIIVSEKHINALVTYAVSNNLLGYYDSQAYVIPTADEAAAFLTERNYDSVNARYGEDTEAFKAPYEADAKPRSAMQIVKACDYYDYQACEAPNYEETTAARLIQRIRTHAISNNPEYVEADWEIID